MTLKALAAGLVLVASAAPALAAPYMAIDAGDRIIALVDRGSIERYGGIRVAQSLWVIKGAQPVVFSIRYNCDMMTVEEIDQRVVTKDRTLGSAFKGKGGTHTPPTGSLGHSLLLNVCQDRLANASGGWTEPDLSKAIDAAIEVGYVPTWP